MLINDWSHESANAIFSNRKSTLLISLFNFIARTNDINERFTHYNHHRQGFNMKRRQKNQKTINDHPWHKLKYK